MRLDVFLYQHGFAPTRNVAQNIIALQCVTVNGKTVTKSAFDVSENDIIETKEIYKSSLGSLKLIKAFESFSLNVNQKICLDLGSANGGFTSILLKNGAKKVYALDIGECALGEELLKNDKVIPVPKTNARYITKESFSDAINFITGDLSFISLKLILPSIYETLQDSGEAVLLIKPQFETDGKNIPKSGIIRDEKRRLKIVDEIIDMAQKIGFVFKGVTEAPHPFENKNQEYLLYLCK